MQKNDDLKKKENDQEPPVTTNNEALSPRSKYEFFGQYIQNDPLSATTEKPWGSTAALNIMQKMGYKLGSGLGKQEQGIKESINVHTNLGKRGLGLKLHGLNISEKQWDFSQENIKVKEKVQWLKNDREQCILVEDSWIVEGLPIENVVGDSSFCNPEVLFDVFKAKDIFDVLDIQELNQARARANPFETIRSAFFMNRAALKMANIDAACDFMFTKIQSHSNPIYFADVCAGPGGFSEYILWKRGWFCKGFGLTLKGEHDFKISESSCASGASFQSLYGADDSGDVCNPDNIKDFTERVLNETDGKGVHFMMSDGGFCVDGQENLQEVLSKNLYLCQCLLALSILRPGGCFVTKLFDIFTPFSIGLIYLMFLSFEKVGIIKPNSSRPANSERYFICNSFKVDQQTKIIKEYLWTIVLRLWQIKTLPDRDILEIVPLVQLKKHEPFFKYIYDSNCNIATNQIISLKKLAQFCCNPELIEPRQEELRKQCLAYWDIPNEKRKPLEIYKVANVLAQVDVAWDVFRIQPRTINDEEILKNTIEDVNNWSYAWLYSSETTNRTNFYVGVGLSKVYRLQNSKWVKVKDLDLAKGSLLFGEFVKEVASMESGQVVTRYSLHIIDALYLGAMNLQGYTFQERMKFIQIFCKSMNRESQTNYSVRVRAKVSSKLSNLPQDYTVQLPKVGFKSVKEEFDVNSILLMKTNNAQTFQSTHVLRVQIFKNQFDSLKQIIVNKLY